jgi:ADP-heptose:LPS heptosyltransferase
MRLIDLLPVLELSGIDLYSFQRGEERAELLQLANARRIHDTALHSPCIVDTAADLLNMDLLITVDTMAAHLAGALGRPVWTLLPLEADWRWMIEREDSPWYPTMRLFRQKTSGDWNSVVAEVVRCLTNRDAWHADVRAGSQIGL